MTSREADKLVKPLRDAVRRFDGRQGKRARSNARSAFSSALRRLRALLTKGYPIERKEPRRVGKLNYKVKEARLTKAGWEPTSLVGHNKSPLLLRELTEVMRELAEAVGIDPRNPRSGHNNVNYGVLWYPRWLYYARNKKEAVKMRYDLHFRRAVMAAKALGAEEEA